MISEFILLILDRSSQLALAIGTTIAFPGLIMVIIPMMNMVAISVPKDSTTVGMGFNSMLRNLGGAVGPVLATTIMTTFTLALTANVSVPSSTAFDIIFYIGIALSLAILMLRHCIKNTLSNKEA